MKKFHTEIEIEASAGRVWQVLADFAAYPDWNPFIQSIAGQMEPGQTLVVRLEPPGGQAATIKPEVLVSQPNREFRWLGHLFVSGLFDGEHSFMIEETAENRVRFVQAEEFRGILVGLMLRMIGDSTLRGFNEMNEALKSRVEAEA